jgi:Domain of unknown function (DUF4381)
MNDALQQLRDLHLPAQPGFWPPAPGWWLLLALLVTLLVWLARRGWRYYQRQRPYRSALSALGRLLHAAEQGTVAQREVADTVNAVLKRALIHGAARHDAAALTDTAWLRYLDRLIADDVFSNGAGAALGNARFAPGFSFDAVAVCAAARRVIVALQRRRSR